MAPKKKESEGIALLSMYNDEDDEMEDLEEELENKESNADRDEEQEEFLNQDDRAVSDFSHEIAPSPLENEESSPKIINFRSPTPPQYAQIPQSSPLPSNSQRNGRGMLTIVDYAHDEMAMSPDAEEGEIVSSGRVMFGLDLQNPSSDFHETTPGNVHILTPSIQATPPQSLEQIDATQYDMNYSTTESEMVEIVEDVTISVEVLKDNDPLDNFLPPPPKTKCSDELQEKINKFLAIKKAGRSFNAEVRNRKEYRNPDFLVHAVRYQDIDQIGSCFSKDVFDPHGYDKSDYYDEIEADVKREQERKEQERKKSQKVDFVSGGTQLIPVSASTKPNIPIPGTSTITAADAVARDARQNKKSKWDKVDGDRRVPLPSGGQDSVSTAAATAAGAHAALLSSANAGAGYSLFAQQRRREAEEKRSSERKLERRS